MSLKIQWKFMKKVSFKKVFIAIF